MPKNSYRYLVLPPIAPDSFISRTHQLSNLPYELIKRIFSLSEGDSWACEDRAVHKNSPAAMVKNFVRLIKNV